jgi:hypothetical protein
MKFPNATVARTERAARKPVHTPYQGAQKPPAHSHCPECNAVFESGRWQWADASDDAHEVVCPACSRIRDDDPAGVVALAGNFLSAHREDILALITQMGEEEKSQNALHRIMRVEEGPASMVVTTTDIQTPRRIGDVLQRTYGGKLESSFDEEDSFLHIIWNREE